MEEREKTAKKRTPAGNAIRTIVFLCLVAFISAVCIKTFTFDDPEKSNTTFDQFYALEKDTVDCVLIGSSVTQRDFVVPVAYHDSGLASYSLTCGAQPFVMARYLMEEVLKTQDPGVFVIELKGSCRGPEDISENALRKMVDNMKPSMNRFRTIKAMVDYSSDYAEENGIDKTGFSYYLPFFKYHSLWNPEKRPVHDDMEYYKGFAPKPVNSFKVKGIDPLPIPDEKMAIAPETEKYLLELLDYSDDIDAKVVFLISPYQASEDAMKKMNYTRGIIEKRGYEVIDFLPKDSREAIGLNDDYCYYNREHLNYYGSLIFTDWFSEYLRDRYELPDRRGDRRYASWEEEYERLQSDLQTGLYAERYSRMMKEVRAFEN